MAEQKAKKVKEKIVIPFENPIAGQEFTVRVGADPKKKGDKGSVRKFVITEVTKDSIKFECDGKKYTNKR